MSEQRRFARTRIRGRVLGVSVVTTVMLMSLLAALPASGSPTGRPHVRVLAPGVAVTTYVDRQFPIRTYVLTVDPAQASSSSSGGGKDGFARAVSSAVLVFPGRLTLAADVSPFDEGQPWTLAHVL